LCIRERKNCVLFSMKLWITSCILALLFVGCWPARTAIHNRPDVKDSERFDYNVAAAGDNAFSFIQGDKDWGDVLKINDWTTDLPIYRSIREKAEEGPTLGMSIIRNDSILFEYYREGYNADNLLTSYSVAKSFLSAMIGIAIDEGKIKGVEQKAIDFLPELKDNLQFQDVTIKHLLNHTSGIKTSLMLEGKMYYTTDVTKIFKNIEFKNKPGEKQAYVNANSQLLGLILRRATGSSATEYLEQKIWQPIGARKEARWNTDAKNKIEKTYCCLNATLLDYAKFGRLFLNKGNWEGKQLVSKDWVKQSLERTDAEGSSHGYNYSWHLGLKEYGDFTAAGLYEQYIYMVPKKNLIIVLFNDRDDKIEMERVNWPYIFRQLADLL